MDVERVGSCSPADLPPPHQVRYTSRQTFLQFRSTRHGIDVEFYRVFTNEQKYVAYFAYADDFDFPYVSFRISFDAPPESPFIQRALVKCLPGVRVGGRLAKPHPSATGC